LTISGGLLQSGGTVRVYTSRDDVAVRVGCLTYAQWVQSAGACLADGWGFQIGCGVRAAYNEARDHYSFSNPGADEARGHYTIAGSSGLTTYGYGALAEPDPGTCGYDPADVLAPALAVGAGTRTLGGTGFMYLGGAEGWSGWIDGGRKWDSDDYPALSVRWLTPRCITLGPAPACECIVSADPTASGVGVLRGWSPSIDETQELHDPLGGTHYPGIRMSGPLENNGRVIADGYGSDTHALDLRGFTYHKPNGIWGPTVINTIENQSRQAGVRFDQSVDNGWFAQNRGIVKLPPVPLWGYLQDAQGQIQIVARTAINWGEGNRPGIDANNGRYLGWFYDDGLDADVDLINSLYMRIDNMSTENTLVGHLLASDREEFQGNGSPLAEGWIPVAIWRLAVENGQTQQPTIMDVKSLSARYDDTQLPAPAEPNLRLIRRDIAGTGWSLLLSEAEQTRDTATHVIKADPADPSPPAEETFALTDEYVAVVLPGWVWRGSSGAWEDDSGSSWTVNANAPSPWPDANAGAGGLAACIDNGGTAILSSGVTGAAATLLLGCNANTTPNSLSLEGGALNVYSLRLGAVDQAAQGQVLVNAGTLTVTGSALIGENGSGTVMQHGGTLQVDDPANGIVHIGLCPTAKGSYLMDGGTLISPRICVGTEGTGVLEMKCGPAGDAIAGVSDLTIRSNLYASGTLQGYGTVGVAGDMPVLTMNGRVIADGYGQDRALDLTGFKVRPRRFAAHYLDLAPLGGIRNNISNVPAYGPTSNGWFAKRGGELRLPTIEVGEITRSSGWGLVGATCSFAWGDSYWIGHQTPESAHVASDSEYQYSIDLINSVLVTFANGSCGLADEPGTTIQIALLASDRAEIARDRALGVGIVPLGVWRMTSAGFPGLSETTPISATLYLNFRYDHTALSEPSEENNLQVQRWMGTGWQTVSQEAPDTEDHIIWGRIEPLLNQTEYLAVVLPRPCWMWNLPPGGGSGGWTEPAGAGAHWDKIPLTFGEPFPDALLYCAYIDNGGTANIGLADNGYTKQADTLYLGSGWGTSGSVNLNYGTLTLNALSIAEAGESAGTFTLAGGTLNVGHVTVGGRGAGELNGYGAVVTAAAPTLTNNGKVMADGNGAGGQPLDLTGFAVIDKTAPNTTDHGWYAVNGGQLKLPVIVVQPDTGYTYNWGEKAYGPENNGIDLVNSLQITPTDAVDGGNLEISLLDAGSFGGIGPCQWQPIGVWRVEASVPFAKANVRARYDLAGSMTEPALVLVRGVQSGSNWSWTITGWAGPVNASSHQVFAPRTDFSGGCAIYLAVLQGFLGDANLDGVVDVSDILAVARAFGSLASQPDYNAACDFNGDGAVDVSDLLILADNFGETAECGGRQQMSIQQPEVTEFQTAPEQLSPQQHGTSIPFWATGQGAMADPERRQSFFEALAGVMPLWDEQQQAEILEALDQIGLLDAYLDYLATQ
jgi:hypothetical protein